MLNNFTPDFADKITFKKADEIMIYHGRNQIEMDFFCYIRCGLQGFKKMHEDYLNKTTALPSSYGEVIYTDFIPEPDEKAKAFLETWLKNNGA